MEGDAEEARTVDVQGRTIRHLVRHPGNSPFPMPMHSGISLFLQTRSPLRGRADLILLVGDAPAFDLIP
jgi:hypothetical protein